MSERVVRIDINKLYGIKNYQVLFENGNLILVGENGSGKTTIARIVYAVLSCNWDLLCTFSFQSIVVFFSSTQIEIEAVKIKSIFRTPDIERFGFFDRHFRRKNEGVLSSIMNLKDQFEKEDSLKKPLGTRFSQGSMPIEYYSEILNNHNVVELYKITNLIRERFQSKIIYLPTYRRIEEPIYNIFPQIERETLEKGRRQGHSDRVIELIEFGMDDVTNLVEKEQTRLKAFSQSKQNKLTLGYLSEIVSKTYDHATSYKDIRSLDENEIQQVLQRIDSSILSSQRKDGLLSILNSVRKEHKHSYSAQVKILCHYFMQILEFGQEINEAEQRIRDFQERCNKYLVNNQLVYNSQEFSCKLINKINGNYKEENEIQFQSLSSGEKQIVSLFSHLYLSDDESGYYVFIDEPELSLSVDWQKMLLPDIVSSPRCRGLFATTHSPFIFENELEAIVHGIDEFLMEG